MTLFPELDADQLGQATRSRWDLDGPLPIPTDGWLACPVCRHGTVQARRWTFHRRDGQSTVPYRCDVSFKCCVCAAVWTHGVVIDGDTWTRMGGRRQIPWRKARQILGGGDL